MSANQLEEYRRRQHSNWEHNPNSSKKRRVSTPQFSDIPCEIFTCIISFLDVQDVMQFSASCQRFHKLAFDTELWQELFKRDFPESEISNADALEEYKNAWEKKNEQEEDQDSEDSEDSENSEKINQNDRFLNEYIHMKFAALKSKVLSRNPDFADMFD
jgi:hypothetical protein